MPYRSERGREATEIPINARAYYDGPSATYRVGAFTRKADGRGTLAMFSEWKEIETAHMVDPVLELYKDEAQQLIQDLWDSGLRPKGVSTESDIVNAQKAHIESLSKDQSVLLEIVRSRLCK